MNKRKKMVVEHAQALFLEKGIQMTSIQDIIERAGISKGTFYNYFSSKYDCVGAILQQIRSEASLLQSELQLGKDPKDINLLIEQTSVIIRINEKRGLSAMFEELLHSGDRDLKKLVLNYKMVEFEWFANRLIEIFGEELRPHALEAAVIWNGMQQHLLFTGKFINQRGLNVKTVAVSVYQYMKVIINSLINENTAVLDAEKLFLLKVSLAQDKIRREDVLLLFDDLIENFKLTKAQMDLATSLRYEIEQDPLRDAVISALLQPFLDSFKGSVLYNQAREIMSETWHFQKQ
ncbi:MAG: TetR/AcrR family transcriptional regulator [Candidatus Pristimantibacillus lignocellulolyticus]|uniref:TetR/AcrR family transcriptional regulator n=1 Tax=Candidatus Pristimantibacillus lignocellulolyticus TaxID=2994561 RepID=A0A9J6ZFU4_9BACL|nr:MAG: TetR/AcrR family transcriptional regulator [Candidatus Pristimantibacillus lignocellulolyticus]